MRIGTRISRPEELNLWEVELVQLSLYKGWRDDVNLLQECAQACRKKDIPYVMHPVSYRILDPQDFKLIQQVAEWSDEALILHDERGRQGGRLTDSESEEFRAASRQLEAMIPVSFENATDTRDVSWF